jgi:serine/threonine-protein phosphatase 2A regulatory subunit B''
MLFVRIKQVEKLDEKAEKIPKQTIINFWKRHMEADTVEKRVFRLLCKPESNVILPEDLKPLFAYLLESHPGLEFLQATPEF